MSERHPEARILIVEDALGVARSLSLGLGLYRGGIFQTETCPSGEEALQRLLEAHFDLLISDFRLPGIDGLILLERARAIFPHLRTILITAFGSAEVEERAHGLANAYLAKPFMVQDIIAVVEHILHAATPSAIVGAAPRGLEEAIVRPKRKPVLRKSVHLTVFACDLDGTLAENGQVAPSTWEALRAAKMAGMVVVLVTGRTLEGLGGVGMFHELCEAIVAENGAVVQFPRRDAVVLPFGRIDASLLRQLELLHVPLERGLAIASTVIPHDEALLRVLRKSRGAATIEYNRNAVMLLPPGATKGSGLLYALDDLGYSAHNVLACGDAENDRSLFAVAELAVAVSNAQPLLRDLADAVLPAPSGAGVELLLNDLLDGKPPPHRPRPTRRLMLGRRVSGTPVHVDPFSLIDTNTGIFGSSGSGKSWLAGLLMEELVKQKYQVCIIDPEGDYRSLGASPRTLLLGGPESYLPPVSDVLNLAEWNNVSLVLDLSTYSAEDRLTYVDDFLRGLYGLRSRRGRPHYFLIDEVQSFCPPEGGRLTDAFLGAMQWGGFGLISYRPSQVAPAILDHLDNVLMTRLTWAEEIDTIDAFLRRFKGGDVVRDQLPMLPKGQAYLCTNAERPGLVGALDAVRFHVGVRTGPHIRHQHKYLRVPLPEFKRFYFNHPDGFNLACAANLWEFRELLATVPAVSLRHHLERGDFQIWLREVLHDEELARRVNKVAGQKLDDDALRRALVEVVAERYEELDAQL